MANAPYTTYIGFGSDLGRSTDGSSYASVGNCQEITPPDSKASDKDISYVQMAAPWRQFQPGMIDPGECTFKLIYEKTRYALLFADFSARATRYWRVAFPDVLTTTGSTLNFQGYVNGLSEPMAIDDEVVVECKIKVSGQVTFTQAT